MPGLLRIPELSWDRIRHPSEIADIGDGVTFLVFNLNDANERPHEQFNGSIKILDTRLRLSQDKTGLIPLPLIQLLQTLRDDSAYESIASPTVFVSANSRGPSDMPLLLRHACVADEITDSANQNAPEDMGELLPVWLAAEFVAHAQPDLTRYDSCLEEVFRKFLSEHT